MFKINSFALLVPDFCLTTVKHIYRIHIEKNSTIYMCLHVHVCVWCMRQHSQMVSKKILGLICHFVCVVVVSVNKKLYSHNSSLPTL